MTLGSNDKDRQDYNQVNGIWSRSFQACMLNSQYQWHDQQLKDTVVEFESLPHQDKVCMLLEQDQVAVSK